MKTVWLKAAYITIYHRKKKQGVSISIF